MKEKQTAKKALALLLCAAMTGGALGGCGVQSASPVQEERRAEAAQTQTKPQHTGTVAAKEETVYVLCGADGAVSKIIVSDWLKNGTAQDTLRDSSRLSDVTVVKGDATYTMDGENGLVWNAAGGDVTYQGTSQDALPVDVSVSYTLDGKAVSAEELAGKSGTVGICFTYRNRQEKTVTIDGKQEKIYAPFVMLTGLMLDSSRFSQVEVSNGKLMETGDHTVAVGFALPGLQQSLGLDTKEVSLPERIEITAQVKDFALPSTLTLATNEPFCALDGAELTSAGDLEGSLARLRDAMSQLTSGSSALYENLGLLLEQSQALTGGIRQIASAAAALDKGAAGIDGGAANLRDGLLKLNAGLGALNQNSAALQTGAASVFDAMLGTANEKLAAAGLSLPTLTRENYAEVLSKLTASLDPASVSKLAQQTALAAVTEQVNAKKGEIEEKVTQGVRVQVLAGVLQQLGYTAEQYQAAVASGQVSEAIQAQVSEAVAAQMASDAVRAQIAQAVAQQVQSAIDTNMKSNAVRAQIAQAEAKASAGYGPIAELKTQLDAYQQFYSGLLQYTAGVQTACEGSKALATGAEQLTGYTGQLAQGLAALDRATATLSDKAAALPDGVSRLKDGAMRLSAGLAELQEKSLSQLSGLLGGDLAGMMTRLQAAVDAAKEYTSFSGVADGTQSSVRFVYKTASVGEDN